MENNTPDQQKPVRVKFHFKMTKGDLKKLSSSMAQLVSTGGNTPKTEFFTISETDGTGKNSKISLISFGKIMPNNDELCPSVFKGLKKITEGDIQIKQTHKTVELKITGELNFSNGIGKYSFL